MATFITSKQVNEFINIGVQTTTSYWKYNHNGTDSSVFGNGNTSVEVLNENGEFTLISCLSDGTVSGDITYLNLDNNGLTSFDGTGLSGLTELYLSNNQLTTFTNLPSSLVTLYATSNLLVGTFDATSLTNLVNLHLNANNLTSVLVSGLTQLNNLTLNGNELTEIDLSGLTSLSIIWLNGNNFDATDNDLILSQLVDNGVNNGQITVSGGRTSAGTADYNVLISRGWSISGAGIPTWYRFKALGTQWTGYQGIGGVVKQIYYQSGGFKYLDFLSTDYNGFPVTFNDDNGGTIEATPVQVTLQEFSSSGSFVAGTGLGGAAIGYANTTAFGSWGTLNSGTLPAIPARYEGQVPAGSVIFSDIYPPVSGEALMLISAPILLSLTLNGNTINLEGSFSSQTGTNPTLNGEYIQLGLEDGETYTFSITWGELVEVVQQRKLRVKGVGQLNP